MDEEKKPCPVCDANYMDYGALLMEDNFTQFCAKSYPCGAFTLCACGESVLELPLNFCPFCGKDFRRADRKRGEWIDANEYYVHCSQCGYKQYSPYEYLPPYCRQCGAKMAGKSK